MTLDGSTIREIVGPASTPGAQPEPRRGDRPARGPHRGALPPAQRGAVLLHGRPGAAARRRTTSATWPRRLRRHPSRRGARAAQHGPTRSCCCAAAPRPTPTTTRSSSTTAVDGRPPAARPRGPRGRPRSPPPRAAGAVDDRDRRPEARHVRRPALPRRWASGTRGWPWAGTRWAARGRRRSSTAGWPRRARRASRPSSRSCTRAPTGAPCRRPRAWPRVPPVARALSLGPRVRDLERGQPLRRAHLPPAPARRRLLAGARRECRPAGSWPPRCSTCPTWCVGAGFRGHAGRAAAGGACTTTSTPTAFARLDAPAAAGDPGRDLAHRGGRHRRAAQPPQGELRRVPAPRGAGRALGLRRLVPLSRRLQRVYVYHWNMTPQRENWDSALIGPSGNPRPALVIVQREAAREASARRARARARARAAR